MIILFILGVLLGGVAIIFASQNIDVITVSFFLWQVTGSLALILVLTFGIGVLTTMLIILPKSINNYFVYRSLKKENKKIEEELRKQKELTVFAKNTPPTEEIISRIEQGAIDNN